MYTPAGAMCSYNALNGAPSCASDFLLNKVLREAWNQTLAHVTTDCGAVRNIKNPPLSLSTELEATLSTFNNGTDMEAGSTFWYDSFPQAIAEGLITEARVDLSVRRGLSHHFKAGRFDDYTDPDYEWAHIPTSVVNSSEHRAVQFSAGEQAVALLKNQNSTLPLKKGGHVAVVGPMADSHVLFR